MGVHVIRRMCMIGPNGFECKVETHDIGCIPSSGFRVKAGKCRDVAIRYRAHGSGTPRYDFGVVLRAMTIRLRHRGELAVCKHGSSSKCSRASLRFGPKQAVPLLEGFIRILYVHAASAPAAGSAKLHMFHLPWHMVRRTDILLLYL